MKIPKIFRTEKDLEGKLEQLIKGPKKIKKEINHNPDEIIEMATQIAELAGEHDELEDHMIKHTYEYQNKKLDLSIQYTFFYNQMGHTTQFHTVKIISKKQKVALTFDDKIKIYDSGQWENHIIELYKNETA